MAGVTARRGATAGTGSSGGAAARSGADDGRETGFVSAAFSAARPQLPHPSVALCRRWSEP